jgi:hypothetical protein
VVVRATDQQHARPRSLLGRAKRCRELAGHARIAQRVPSPRALVLHEKPTPDCGRGTRQLLAGLLTPKGAAVGDGRLSWFHAG